MERTRTNSGKQTGLLIAKIGSWNLRQTDENRYKVAAIEAINGKANYSFGVKDGHIDTHVGLDCTKLAEERPELYKSIEEYLKSTVVSEEVTVEIEETDPYGDLAISRHRKLTPEQNWKRGLLNMRRIEFEHAAVKSASIWDSAIRMLWAGIFETKISDEDLQKAKQWVVQRNGSVDLKGLLQLEQDFYAGKFAPNSCVNLEAGLNSIVGATDYENVEEIPEDPLDAFR